MRSLRRSLFVAIPLILVALAAPLAASADSPLAHSGRFGVHVLADSQEFPGARCAYDDSTVIESIRVRDPLVFARDKNPDRVDSQMVSWKFRVQAQSMEGWATVASSDLQKRRATDAQVANFSPMREAFDGDAGTNYRVLVVIFWYGADGSTTAGRVIHRADWYAWQGVPSFEGSCPGGLF